MSVCYFNSEFDKKYDCEYQINDGTIEVIVDYDIMDEIEAVNGVKVYGIHTEFDIRDILIIDYQTKKNFLVKQAYFSGSNRIFGTPDSGSESRFRSNLYFEHSKPERLSELPATPKISKIKIFSKSLLEWIGYPSLEITKTADCQSVNLFRNRPESVISINCNYIRSISVSDDWNYLRSSNDKRITVDFTGYLEIELMRKVNYEKIPEFVNELLIFMQLYCPDNFAVEKIYVMVNEHYYILSMPLLELKCQNKHFEKTVDDTLLEFLKRCYTKIPYRNSKTDIRNIPYIIMKTARNMEDNFLMFYRFIECFYKKTNPEARKKFISFSINDHYANKHSLSNDQIESYTQEIISLRNHYVHAGYYIKNASLRVSFDKIGRRKNPKDYTATNIDVHWIYERTSILYKIVIDIIFIDMLGYEDYQFRKHF